MGCFTLKGGKHMKHNKLWNRLLSLVLCLCMVLSLMPGLSPVAQAEDGQEAPPVRAASDCSHNFNADGDIRTAATCRLCGLNYTSDSRWTVGVYQEFLPNSIIAQFAGHSYGSTDELVAYYVANTEKDGFYRLSFDWAINQGYIYYGEFTMELYHNDEKIFYRDFTENPNPYYNILSEEYFFVAEGESQVFKFVFRKLYSGSWADGGRHAYLNNIVLEGCQSPKQVDGVYQIANAEDLYYFADLVNNGNTGVHAELTADIDMAGRYWIPIGFGGVRFSGSFDGRGHKIRDFFMEAVADGDWGLFGYVENATVQDFSIEGSVIVNRTEDEDKEFHLGVIGHSYAGPDQKVYVLDITSDVNISVQDHFLVNSVAGVVGAVDGSTGSWGMTYIQKCIYTGSLELSMASVHCGGGITGYIGYYVYVVFDNCLFAGRYTGPGGQVGGIFGYGYGQNICIYNCLSAGSLAISDRTHVGGIGGRYHGQVNDRVDMLVDNNYYTQELLAFSDDASLGDDLTELASYGEDNARKLTDAQVRSGEAAWLLNGGDAGIWTQTIGDDRYPGFKGLPVYYTQIGGCCDINLTMGYANQKEPVTGHIFENGFCTGCAVYEEPQQNAEGVYEIYNAGQLYWFAQYVNDHKFLDGGDPDDDYDNIFTSSAAGKLMADIVVNPGSFAEDGTYTPVAGESVRNWTPIEGYEGIFDGNGKTVSGLYYDELYEYFVGFFTTTDSEAVVKNMGLINSFLRGGKYVGGIVGRSLGTIENCYVTCIVMGAEGVGGIAGNSEGTVRYCYSTATVKASDAYCGAICGENDGAVAYCYYLPGTAVVGSGKVQYGLGSNKGNVCADREFVTTGMSAEDFASGKLTRLLNVEKDDGIWKQELGRDPSPNFSSKTVYRIWESCCEGGYTNDSAQARQRLPHDFVRGFCTLCDEYEPAVCNAEGIYEISNPGQLYWFAREINTGRNSISGKLMCDICVNPGTMNSYGGYTPQAGEKARIWIPMGQTNSAYGGTFEGQGYTVSGLYFRDNATDYVGFFSKIKKGGTVKNLGIVNSSFSGVFYVGGIAAEIAGTVTNCWSDCVIYSSDSYAGGIAGENYGTIDSCRSASAVHGIDEEYCGSVGGIVGRNGGILTNSYATGTVDGRSNVGGLAGFNYGILRNCYSMATVNGQSYVGAVSGYSGGITMNCYYLPGFATDKLGTVQYGIGAGTAGEASPDHCDVTMSLSGEDFASGRAVFLLNDGNAEGAAVWKQTLGMDEAPNFTGKTVYYTWATCGDVTYSNDSSVGTQRPEHSFGEDSNGFCIHCDAYEPAVLAGDGVYEIYNAGQLYWFMVQFYEGDTSISARLMRDIVINPGTVDFDGTYTPVGDETLRNWNPIGNGMVPYSGCFDGKGHSISGLYGNLGYIPYSGLFGYLAVDATVKNLGLSNIYIKGNIDVGGIAGYNKGAISNCYVTGDIRGSEYIGGIVGYNQRNSARSIGVNNCWTSCVIDCTNGYGGGIVGRSGCDVANCYALGTVTGPDYCGAVIGYNDDDLINCYYNSDVFSGPGVGAGGGTVEGKTTAQFASGEVAYLLQENLYVEEGLPVPQVWGQNIDNGGAVEAYPVLSDARVYRIMNCDGENLIAYSNTYRFIPHTIVDCYCTTCGNRVHEEATGFTAEGFCPVCDLYQPPVLNGDVYEISNAGQLYWYAEHVNSGILLSDGGTPHPFDHEDDVYSSMAKAMLMNDIVVNEDLMSKLVIDENGIATVKEGEKLRVWTPLGKSNCPRGYGGTFYGNGHKISGLYYNDPTVDRAALVDWGNENSVIRDLGVVDSYFRGDDDVAAIAGLNMATISNCYSTALICGDSIVGGIAATSQSNSITDCYVVGDVYGNSSVGGVVGYTTATTTNCYHIGTVKGNARVGGVVGNNAGITTNCYHSGAVIGTGQVGGVAGYVFRGGIYNSYFDTDTYTGAAIGEVIENTPTVGVVGKTQAEFASGEVAYLLARSCVVDGTTYSGAAWTQNLDHGEEPDPFPVFGHGKVYMVVACNGVGQDYSNGLEQKDHVPAEDDGDCTTPICCRACNLLMIPGREAHEYANDYCIFCGMPDPAGVLDPTIRFNHTLNLASDISCNFAILSSLVKGYDMSTAYVEFTVNEYSGNVLTGTRTVKVTGTVKGAYYYFTFTGLNAVMMNDDITAVFYGRKDGVLYRSEADVYSVADYALSQLNNAASPEALKTLCADLLRYGATAQSFKGYRVDALADSCMTEAHRAYLSDGENVKFDNYNSTANDMAEPTVSFAGKALVLDSKITMKYIVNLGNYTGKVEDLTLYVSYLDINGQPKMAVITDPTVYNQEKHQYAFAFDGLLAAELRQAVSVAVYNGNTRLSPMLTYSASTYGNGKTGLLLTLCKHLMAYSDSARAYFQN